MSPARHPANARHHAGPRRAPPLLIHALCRPGANFEHGGAGVDQPGNPFSRRKTPLLVLAGDGDFAPPQFELRLFGPNLIGKLLKR